MNAEQETLITGNLSIVARVVGREMARGLMPWVDRSDLEDVANVALVTAALKFEGGCDFGAFAYRTVRNAVFDELRASRVRNGNRSEMPAVEDEREPMSGKDMGLYSALLALPPDQYRVAVLTYWGDKSQGEIAEALGISQPRVSKILGAVNKSLAEVINSGSQTHIQVKGEKGR